MNTVSLCTLSFLLAGITEPEISFRPAPTFESGIRQFEIEGLLTMWKRRNLKKFRTRWIKGKAAGFSLTVDLVWKQESGANSNGENWMNSVEENVGGKIALSTSNSTPYSTKRVFSPRSLQILADTCSFYGIWLPVCIVRQPSHDPLTGDPSIIPLWFCRWTSFLNRHPSFVSLSLSLFFRFCFLQI